jgi:hypothetical protein
MVLFPFYSNLSYIRLTRQLGKPMHRRQNHRKIYLKEIVRCEDLNWIYLGGDRVQWWATVNTKMQFWVSQKAVKFLIS